MKTLILILCVLSYILACNNYCSGHGTCELKEKCSCFPGWGGADCQLRSCPYGEAYIDLMLGDLNHDGKVTEAEPKTEWYPDKGLPENLKDYVTNDRAHRYAECSNAGVCDRTTGVCNCFEGFEGSSCQRRTCPSNTNSVCSGHGSCISTSIAVDHMPSNPIAGWEYDKFYSCMCDEGWKNMDCSERICPKGLDPSSAQTPPEFKYTYELPIKDNNNNKYTPTHFFRYKFNNHIYTSPLVNDKLVPTDEAADNNAKISEIQEEIRKTLAVIPPLSQSRVEIEKNQNNNYDSPLTVNIYAEYCDYDLFYHKESYLHVYYNKNKYDQATRAGDEIKDNNGKKVERKPIECSNKGVCNTETGMCECLTGYYGIACQLAS